MVHGRQLLVPLAGPGARPLSLAALLSTPHKTIDTLSRARRHAAPKA
jgi:hypothetical protein